MKKKLLEVKLKLSKVKVSHLQISKVIGGTNGSQINCTTRPSDNYSDCCLLTNNLCTGGTEVTAPSIEWCVSAECVAVTNPCNDISLGGQVPCGGLID